MDKFVLYHVQILKNILSQRQKRNPKYSMREFARNLGVSSATLSQIFSQKKGLSEIMALSISENLKLEDAEKKVFLLSVRSAHSRSARVKLESSLELAEIRRQNPKSRKANHGPNEILNDADRFLLESMEVQQFMSQAEVHAVYRYASVKGEMQIRILNILKDKATGQVLNDFVQITFNEKTRQGATVYFLKKTNGRFKTYFNNIFDGKHRVTGLVAENQNTEITFDQDFLPTIQSIRFLMLGANKHVIGKMQYTPTEFTVKGTLVDLDQPDQPLDSSFDLRLVRRK